MRRTARWMVDAKAAPRSGNGKRGSLFRRVDATIPSAVVDDAFAALVGDASAAMPTLRPIDALKPSTSSSVTAERTKQAQRLKRLRVPHSVAELKSTTYGELTDVVEEWRDLVHLNGNEGRSEHTITIDNVGEVCLRLQSNSCAIHAAYSSQLLPSINPALTPAPLQRRVVCDSEVVVLVGDAKETESAAVKAKAARITPTEAGYLTDEGSIAATRKIENSTNTELQEASLAQRSGRAYQYVTTNAAQLRFRYTSAQYSASTKKRNPNVSKLGGALRVHDPFEEGTADRAKLEESKQLYTNESTEQSASTPVTVVDNTGHRFAVVSPRGGIAVPRDVIRGALQSAFLTATVPVVDATVLAGVVISNAATGDALLLLGPKGSGRLTTALHAMARCSALRLVSSGIFCAANASAFDANRFASSSARVDDILARAGSPKKSPFAPDDVALFGPPLHPLVGIGAVIGTDPSDPLAKRLRQWYGTAQVPHLDACDRDLFKNVTTDLYHDASALWLAAHRVRLDVARCFHSQTSSSNTTPDSAATGRLRHIVLLDWHCPQPHAANTRVTIPMRFTTRSNAWADPYCSAPNASTCTVSRIRDPDVVKAAFTRYAKPSLHRSLRHLIQHSADDDSKQAVDSDVNRLAEALADTPSRQAAEHAERSFERFESQIRGCTFHVASGAVHFPTLADVIVTHLTHRNTE